MQCRRTADAGSGKGYHAKVEREKACLTRTVDRRGSRVAATVEALDRVGASKASFHDTACRGTLMESALKHLYLTNSNNAETMRR